MQGPRSLGYATDLMIAEFDGVVLAGPGFLAARTPTSPLFWWGNFVVFEAPPRPGQVAEWAATFDDQVGCVPGVQHRNLAWDTDSTRTGAHDPQGALHGSKVPEVELAIAEFLAAGYQRNTSVVLMNSAPQPAPHSQAEQAPTACLVRPIKGDAEWERVLEIQHASMPSQRSTPTFRTFQTQQRDRDRRLVARVWRVRERPTRRHDGPVCAQRRRALPIGRDRTRVTPPRTLRDAGTRRLRDRPARDGCRPNRDPHDPRRRRRTDLSKRWLSCARMDRKCIDQHDAHTERVTQRLKPNQRASIAD